MLKKTTSPKKSDGDYQEAVAEAAQQLTPDQLAEDECQESVSKEKDKELPSADYFHRELF